MTQQTAVDWLISNLPNRFRNAILNDCVQELKQAREMEREQIMRAYRHDLHPMFQGDAEGYYSDTYGQQTEGQDPLSI